MMRQLTHEEIENMSESRIDIRSSNFVKDSQALQALCERPIMTFLQATVIIHKITEEEIQKIRQNPNEADWQTVS